VLPELFSIIIAIASRSLSVEWPEMPELDWKMFCIVISSMDKLISSFSNSPIVTPILAEVAGRETSAESFSSTTSKLWYPSASYGMPLSVQ
jgi:hypothetical protein